jgi:hypothetical protein
MLAVLAVLDDLFNNLEKVSTSQWFYVIIFLIAFLDSVFPVVPSETAVILGGIAAGQGHLNLAAVIFLGATGALAISPTLMPNLSYDPTRDMAPISKLAISPLVLTVPLNSPIKTLAASGIKDFGKLLKVVADASPIRRNVTIDDVGNVAAFLLSDLAGGVTAEITYVDGGFNKTMGVTTE